MLLWYWHARGTGMLVVLACSWQVEGAKDR